MVESGPPAGPPSGSGQGPRYPAGSRPRPPRRSARLPELLDLGHRLGTGTRHIRGGPAIQDPEQPPPLLLGLIFDLNITKSPPQPSPSEDDPSGISMSASRTFFSPRSIARCFARFGLTFAW